MSSREEDQSNDEQKALQEKLLQEIGKRKERKQRKEQAKEVSSRAPVQNFEAPGLRRGNQSGLHYKKIIGLPGSGENMAGLQGSEDPPSGACMWCFTFPLLQPANHFEDGSVRTFSSLRSTIYPTICIIKHTERTTEFNILFHTFYIEIIED